MEIVFQCGKQYGFQKSSFSLVLLLLLFRFVVTLGLDFAYARQALYCLNQASSPMQSSSMHLHTTPSSGFFTTYRQPPKECENLMLGICEH
jgi:hypothetical protein